MKIDKIALNKLNYNYTNYPAYLKDSIKRIGFNFPIVVDNEINLNVVDGHKRLSALQDLLQEDTSRSNLVTVRYQFKRTTQPNSMRNTH